MILTPCCGYLRPRSSSATGARHTWNPSHRYSLYRIESCNTQSLLVSSHFWIATVTRSQNKMEAALWKTASTYFLEWMVCASALPSGWWLHVIGVTQSKR